MREFIVTLRCGVKFVVKAERVVLLDRQFLALAVSRPEADDPNGDTVALFDRSQVAAVVARDHLILEERGEPLVGRFTDVDADDPIPF
jgi:hypothetical protein